MKKEYYWWMSVYIVSFTSLVLALFNVNSSIVNLFELMGSITRFFLILNMSFIKITKPERVVLAILALFSIFGTILAFAFILFDFEDGDKDEINIKEFTKRLFVLLIGAWALDAITILPIMKYYNSVQFSMIDVGRALVAIIILFFIFKRKPKFNLIVLAFFVILVFLFYQYGQFFGTFLLSWPM